MTARKISRQIINCFNNGGKALFCGNGGSASQSNHFAGELVGKFEHKRRGLPAISLTADNAILTAISNDWGYAYVFARQIEALGKVGDIVIGISTSGKSHNVINAKLTAEEYGLTYIDLPRKGNSTAKIQEYQLKLIHDICRLVEKAFI